MGASKGLISTIQAGITFVIIDNRAAFDAITLPILSGEKVDVKVCSNLDNIKVVFQHWKDQELNQSISTNKENLS